MGRGEYVAPEEMEMVASIRGNRRWIVSRGVEGERGYEKERMSVRFGRHMSTRLPPRELDSSSVIRWTGAAFDVARHSSP